MAEEPHTWGDSFPEKCPPPPGSGLLTTLTHPRAQAHTRPPHTHTHKRALPAPAASGGSLTHGSPPGRPAAPPAGWGPAAPRHSRSPHRSRGGARGPLNLVCQRLPLGHVTTTPLPSVPIPSLGSTTVWKICLWTAALPRARLGLPPRGPGMPSPGDGLQTSCGLPVIPHSSPSHPAPCTDPLSRPTGPICSDPDWASGAPSGPPLCAPAGRTPALRVSHPLPAGFPHSAEAVPSPPCPHGRQSKPLP